MHALDFIRYGVFAVSAASALVAVAAWAVRTRQVSPFSPLGRALRELSEPIVRRVEHWMVKNGGNPQNAALWIFVVPLVGGILVIGVAGWAAGQIAMVGHTATSGRGALRLTVYYAGQLLMLALLVRVIGSWLGQYQYSRWMRPVYLLTDWMIEPLRKIIPPFGMFDITPLIAWFGLRLVLGWLMSAI